MKTAMKIERERRGWTLREIAAATGVSEAQISRIENRGIRSVQTAKVIAALFGNLTLEDICVVEPGSRKPVRSVELQEAS